MVERTGGRYSALDHYGAYPLTKAIQEAPDYPRSIVITTAIILLAYQGIFTSLTVAFGILGVRGSRLSGNMLAAAAAAPGSGAPRRRRTKPPAVG